MPYLNVDEVASALEALRDQHSFVQLIDLPNLTAEGTLCRAVRIQAGPKQARINLLVTAGSHAREYVPPDAVVQFLETLTRAYVNGAGVMYGAFSLTAEQVKAILETFTIYAFPLVNPDGRRHCMSSADWWWRKNRASNPGGPDCIGTDINRNFDFLWDYRKHFAWSLSDAINTKDNVRSSDQPCVDPNQPNPADDPNNTYVGAGPHSEAETQNVAWLLASFPQIRFVVDIHSSGGNILYTWGDDHSQYMDPDQNFLNPAYDGQRGVNGQWNPGDPYREFIERADLEHERHLAQLMAASCAAAHGDAYGPTEGYGFYPTSGTLMDYARSRAYLPSTSAWMPKRRALVIECGSKWQPPYDSEARQDMDAVCAGLAGLCLDLLDPASPYVHVDAYIKDHPNDDGTEPSAGVFWNDSDVWARQHYEDGNDKTEHQPLKAGQKNYVYVQVTNRGSAATKGLKVEARILPWAGTEFVYPLDWKADSYPSIRPILLNPSEVEAGQTMVFKFELNETMVQSLHQNALAGSHPCILAVAQARNDFADGGLHTWENNNLAQRNISFVQPEAEPLRIDFRFLAGHAQRPGREVDLRIDTMGLPEGTTARLVSTRRKVARRVHPPGTLDARQLPPRWLSALDFLARSALHTLRMMAGETGAPPTPRPWNGMPLAGVAQVTIRRAPNSYAPVTIQVQTRREPSGGALHVSQVVDGRAVGGVTLQIPLKVAQATAARPRLVLQERAPQAATEARMAPVPRQAT